MRNVATFLRSVAAVLALTTLAFAQQQGEAPSLSPQELVRRTIENETRSTNGGNRFMFRGTKTTPKGSTTKLYVETKDATAGMVIAYDGRPLTAEQRRAEQDRIQRFINNPDELRKKRKQEQEDADRTMRIVRALPAAFLYEYDGEEQGRPGVGRPGDPLVRLRFRPNPQYEPPTRVEQVLTGMQGILLIDAVHYRIAQIDGTLFREVGFGWGILGHLDKGGHFLVQQEDVADNCWEVSKMSLSFTGKILFFKSLSISSTELYTDYQRVPADLSFAQAVELLKKQEAIVADKSTSSRMTENAEIKQSRQASSASSSEMFLPER